MNTLVILSLLSTINCNQLVPDKMSIMLLFSTIEGWNLSYGEGIDPIVNII